MPDRTPLALLFLLASVAPLTAAPDPFLEPANLGARFLFHGGGAVTPDIATAFRRLCRSEAGVPLALIGGTEEDRKWWAGHGFSPALPAEATAIWIRTDGGFALADLGAATLDLLRSHLLRHGVLAISGPGCAAFAGEEFAPAPDVPLLPYAFVETSFVPEKRDALLERVDARPGHIGYGLPEGTALLVDGRQFRVIGETALTICLPTSETRPGNYRFVRPAHNADHLALVRAAHARALDPVFPPAEFPEISLPAGTLIVVGGGPTPSRVLQRFVDAAHGGPILVVPTAESESPASPDSTLELFRKYGAKEVRTLHARTAAEGDRDAFTKIIDTAGGIWFNGGRQWRLVDRYANTRAHEAMLRLLARGGVIGGSSAGATICGDYLVRGSPLGPDQMMCEGYERGLSFLPGTAIDQHVSQRNRFADMEALKATFPQLLGIGLDEATAVVVKGDSLEAVGRGNVFVYNGTRQVNTTNFPRLILSDRMRYSLKTRELIGPEPSL
jgi:cyanophycinase